MSADPLTTRIAVAIHGATPPNPDAALALHRDAAERVLPVVVAEVARLRAAVEALMHPERGMAVDAYGNGQRWFWEDDLRAALATAEEPGA